MKGRTECFVIEARRRRARNKGVFLVAAIMLSALWALAGSASAATIGWTGDGLTDNWSEVENWDALAAPIDTDTAVFGEAGVVADDSVTSIVDLNAIIGGLDVTAVGGNHRIDLNSNTLTIDGRVALGLTTISKTTRITNGTLQIGTEAGPARSLYVGGSGNWQDTTGGAYLLLSGVAFNGYLDLCSVGYGNWINTPVSTLDLQNATVSVFRANRLILGTGNSPSSGTIKLSAATGLTEINVKNELTFAIAAGTARIGDAGNQYKLPPNVNLVFGVWDATRCNLEIARCSGSDFLTDGRIIASSGGTCTGYFGTFKLAQHQGGSQSYAAVGSAVGTVDLSAMNSVAIDATSIEIAALGPMASPGHNGGRGLLALPAGTVNAGTVIVAHPDVYDDNADPAMKGELILNGTVFTVATAMTVGPRGTVTATLNGSPAGLDLASGATLVDRGNIRIIFAPADPNPEELYWGLRWAGNHQAELLALKNDGKLAWDDTAIGGGVNIVYVADDDATYVAVAEVTVNLAPVARVKNATKGFDPAMGETGVTFVVADVDDVSYDPDGPPWAIPASSWPSRKSTMAHSTRTVRKTSLTSASPHPMTPKTRMTPTRSPSPTWASSP